MDMDKVVDTTDKSIPKKDQVVTQALSRYRTAVDFEKENRADAIDDLEMLAGRNHWPPEIARQRELDGRPTLVINKLPGFADRVVNESRINQIAIKVIPFGSGASKDIADVYNGHIKAIERFSDAEVAYQTAFEGAVYCGFGYFRIITSFTDETSFDQEIQIARIKNNMTVRLDPYHVKHDGSDGRFAFIDEMISPEEYKARYPKSDPPVPMPNADVADSGTWIGEDRIRVAEYWVKVPKKKTLLLLSDGRTVDAEDWAKVLPELESREKLVHIAPGPDGQLVPVDGPAPAGTGFPEKILNLVPKVLRDREVDSHVIQQYLIDGEKVIEGPTEWPGIYIPIIPVWGKEVTIDEITHRRGVIRFAKDPQRMYNFFRTAATETVALAPKAPYIIADEQIEGHEDDWAKANVQNKAFLVYTHVAGVQLPQRQIVTQTAIGEITESNISSDEMKDTTDIQDASLGIAGNEVSGRAIARRQSQSDVVNFTYSDNLKRSIKYAGKILVDLIPRIYDTERQIAIIRPDDEQEMVTINQEVELAASGERQIINDLTQGRFMVTVTTGPNFNTQRDEAAASMMDFIRVAPDVASLAIDLIAENQNWPGAEKIAARFRKVILPPGIDDDDGPPQEPQPSADDMLKQLKSQGIMLGNELKKLNIVEKRQELTDETEGLVKLVKQLQSLGQLRGERNEGG